MATCFASSMATTTDAIGLDDIARHNWLNGCSHEALAWMMKHSRLSTIVVANFTTVFTASSDRLLIIEAAIAAEIFIL